MSSDEGEDLFFDCLSSQGSSLGKLDYEIWINEPKSVKERRVGFLQAMDLVHFASTNDDNECTNVIETDRILESGGAVTISSALSSEEVCQNSVSCERGTNEANSMVDDLENTALESELTPEAGKYEHAYFGKKKLKTLWKLFGKISKRREPTKVPTEMKMNVSTTKKSYMELTAISMQQKIQAHKGSIWTMKISPNGKYLASAGEDGVVRIWRITSTNTSFKSFPAKAFMFRTSKERKSTPFLLPNKLFRIEESPIQEFHGHSSDVLDLAWSKTNCLLSSSKDKTVRLWKVGCEHCLGVFHHTNYVTCIQFNPVDESYFISGCIDGKARIWGVSDKRVVDWACIKDVVSAICYTPDGQGFVVGTIKGTCSFFEASGRDLQRLAEICIAGKKRMSGRKITGIEYCKENSDRVMISSEDSKIRILDGLDIVCKFKGLQKSGSQMSASFTSNGKHIVSIGEDSRVYMWNHDEYCLPKSKTKKSTRSCEYFSSEGVSVAVPWQQGTGRSQMTGLDSCSSSSLIRQLRDSERHSRGNCKGGSATWPEEKLGIVEDEYYECSSSSSGGGGGGENENENAGLLEAWGLVIVTAGLDGSIRTFHNYGLPMRLST